MTMNRSKMIRIVVRVIVYVLILAIILLFAIPCFHSCYCRGRPSPNVQACLNNLRMIDSGKEQWARSHTNMVMPNMTNEYKMKETELAYRKHMFKEMSFPKGNVLVWLAVLSETLYRDAGELSLKVVVDVGIPVLSNRTHRADSNLISQIRSDMADYYQDALVGKNESVGIAIEHESFTATYVTLGQIIDICQSVFGCSMTAKGEYLHVRLFPPILTVVEYPLGTDRLNMALDVICGNNKNPLRGMVYESPQQNIVCVVAPVKSLKDFEDILKNNTETDIDDDQE